MILRKSPKHMTTGERNAFVDAVVALKNKQESLQDGSTIGKYDQHVALHLGVTARLRNGTPIAELDGGHGGPGFLPWHREFLLRIEKDLEEESNNADLAIPFWDWTDQETTFDTIFKDDFLGKFDDSGLIEVRNARFARNDAWKLDQRVRMKMIIDLIFDPNASPPEWDEILVRSFSSKTMLPSLNTIDFVLEQSDYDTFRRAIERGIPPHRRTHNFMHGWVSGVMGSHASPYDPIFLLNHAFIDRVWALWQALGHQGPTHYTTESNPAAGHGLTDPMWPWDGSEPVTTVGRLEAVIPQFDTTDLRKPEDVLDCKMLGFSYVHWKRIKEILDGVIERWKEQRGGLEPRLSGIHGSSFNWDTKENLLNAIARGRRLIEPNLIGNNQGHKTYLVQALQFGFPLDNVRRMPAGGPHLKLTEIAEVAHWIDMGCPDEGSQIA